MARPTRPIAWALGAFVFDNAMSQIPSTQLSHL
jgi:hypothetical protein